MLVDTFGPIGHPKPTKNEFKDGVRMLGFRARWNDGGDEGTPLPESLASDESFKSLGTVEKLAEAYKGASSKTFFDFLPEDSRQDPAITKYKTAEDFIKGYKSAAEMVGRKGIIVPGENATEEEKQAYFKALGVPDKPEVYKFKAPDSLHPEVKITPEFEGNFGKLAHKLKLTPAQADGLFQEYTGLLSQSLAKRDEENKVNRDNTEAKLRQEWGKDFVENATIAKRVVEKFGGKEALEAFGDLGNNPKVMRFLANLGKKISEDSFRGVGSIDLSTDSHGAKSRIKQIEADPDFMNSNSPRHSALIEERTKLYEIAYSGE